jgi:hypothetical protein
MIVCICLFQLVVAIAFCNCLQHEIPCNVGGPNFHQKLWGQTNSPIVKLIITLIVVLKYEIICCDLCHGQTCNCSLQPWLHLNIQLFLCLFARYHHDRGFVYRNIHCEWTLTIYALSCNQMSNSSLWSSLQMNVDHLHTLMQLYNYVCATSSHTNGLLIQATIIAIKTTCLWA